MRSESLKNIERREQAAVFSSLRLLIVFCSEKNLSFTKKYDISKNGYLKAINVILNNTDQRCFS
jgi:hypothetical protein